MSDDLGHDVAVRIGCLCALEAGSPDRLVAVGLGSCAGVVVVDPATGACAMAHVFLPELPPGGAREGAGPGTYADAAVPRLVESVRRMGSGRSLVGIVAGGAQMFGARPGNDVGARNVEAVRAALASARVPIVAEDVGGSSGRTLRAASVDGVLAVTVRVVGSAERALWSERTSGIAGTSIAA